MGVFLLLSAEHIEQANIDVADDLTQDNGGSTGFRFGRNAFRAASCPCRLLGTLFICLLPVTIPVFELKTDKPDTDIWQL